MKFYEFGEKAAPVILLLPGTRCHWKTRSPFQELRCTASMPQKWVQNIWPGIRSILRIL